MQNRGSWGEGFYFWAVLGAVSRQPSGVRRQERDKLRETDSVNNSLKRVESGYAVHRWSPGMPFLMDYEGYIHLRVPGPVNPLGPAKDGQFFAIYPLTYPPESVI